MAIPQKNPWRPLRRWEKAILATVGVLIVAWATFQTWKTWSFLAHCERVTGVVVENTGHPVIRFTAANGATVQFVQNGYVSRDAGSAIPVAYDPRDPAGTARADTFLALWASILGLLPMSFGCLAAAFLGGEIRLTGRHG